MGRDLICCEQRGRVGLLVSVRNAAEALAALDGGADVIDVKEPSRGPLGAADAAVVLDVVRTVAVRAPVSVALGELIESPNPGPGWPGYVIPGGVSHFKIGLAGCGSIGEWYGEWQRVVQSLAGSARPVAVVYADWRAAGAIEPVNVVEAAVGLGCPVILVDTWDKSAGTLFDHWTHAELRKFIASIREQRMIAVLAGSLSLRNVREAAALGPDYIAVRGAACDAGRSGVVSRERVRALCERLVAEVARPSLTS